MAQHKAMFMREEPESPRAVFDIEKVSNGFLMVIVRDDTENYNQETRVALDENQLMEEIKAHLREKEIISPEK